MLYLDYIKKLTGLQDIILENVERTDGLIILRIKMERKLTKYPLLYHIPVDLPKDATTVLR